VCENYVSFPAVIHLFGTLFGMTHRFETTTALEAAPRTGVGA
jgi:hypothetical protein